MTHSLATTASSTVSAFPRLYPRLARRAEISASSSRAWLTPGFGASTAYISLGAGLVCVFDTHDITGLSHQFIGSLGLTPHQAWKSATHSLLRSCQDEEALTISASTLDVASTTPRGVQLHCREASPASWLTHPELFSTLHNYMHTVLTPQHELLYFSRDQQELFIFDSTLSALSGSVERGHVMRFSVGFPLLCTPPTLA